jgi:putative ABC transport system substrate-binding protein
VKARACLPALLLLSVLLVASFAEAQQAARVWRIGLFHVGLDHVPPSFDTMRAELKALGYEEGKTIHLDWRNLPDEEAARRTAWEFVRQRVDLMVAWENQTVRAAMAATSEIPIVMLHASDPLADGFVKSLSRPGGNVTGFAGLGDIPSKRLELFKEAVPRLRRLLALIDPKDPVTPRTRAEVRKAAKVLKITLVEREATSQADIERVFASLRPREVDGVFIVSPNLSTNFSSLVTRLARSRGLPVPSHRKEWVSQGALLSYSHDIAAVGPEAARYIDRILRGAKPADLPVAEPVTFELAVNLKTAKALGISIPESVLLRADHVIR